MTVTDDIKQRIDLVDFITASGVALRKAGRNWTGFCPFHPNTRTPAFYVFPDTQSYYCFGCHAAGDAFNFVMQRQGLDFAAVLEQLAARAGVQLEPRTPEQATENARIALLRQINEDAAVYWQHLLRNTPRGAAGRDYATARGLDDAALERWQIGYAAAEWTNLLVYLTDRKNHAPEDIEAAGLVIRREGGGYYDRFRNRLIFPIRDQRGVIAGFGGRTLGDDHAKYLNTPETPLFHKGRMLFGLYEGRENIRRQDAIVLVEGYLDVITAHQAGFGNVVAPMGTALTTEQAGLIKKLTRTIILALDADAAGTSATLKSLATLQDHLQTTSDVPVATPDRLVRWEHEVEGVLKIASLPPGQDPDDVIKTDPAQWRSIITAAVPLLDFYIRAYTADLDLTSAKGRATAVERLAPLIAAVANDVERAHYVQQVAELVGLDRALIGGAIESVRRRRAVPAVVAAAVTNDDTRYAREDQLLSLLLRFPQIQAGVTGTLQGELARFPVLVETIRGDIREAIQRTENRWIWDLWNEQGPAQGQTLEAWAEGLTPPLRQHAHSLVQWTDTPELPAYGPHLQAAQVAEAIALELRKSVVQQRRQQIKAMYESVDDPVEQHGLLTVLQALNDYQSVITMPRRSSYFQDLSSRLEHLG